MKLFLLASSLILALFTLAQGAGKTGKLVGHVDIGPLTPVERPGVKIKVPPEMYRQYTIVISQRGPHNGMMKSHMRRLVANLKLSDTGDFSTNLAPGDYLVAVRSEKPMRVPTPEQEVTIVAGKTKKVKIEIDTGIR
jgi:hypothetical protein